MSLVTRSLPSLHGGVSQQSPLVRSPDQLESLTNGWPSIATGLTKRAPSEVVARLMPTAPENAHIHAINRDSTEQYVVIVADGQIKVFDTLTGQEKPVTAPGGWAYLSTVEDYGTDISAFSVADYTFITNRRMKCAMGALGADTQPHAEPTFRRTHKPQRRVPAARSRRRSQLHVQPHPVADHPRRGSPHRYGGRPRILRRQEHPASAERSSQGAELIHGRPFQTIPASHDATRPARTFTSLSATHRGDASTPAQSSASSHRTRGLIPRPRSWKWRMQTPRLNAALALPARRS